MKPVFTLFCALLAVASPAVTLAQVVAPIPITGPAQAAMQQLHPPAPLDQVRELATRRSPPLPAPTPPVERWVPERQVYLPDLGRTVLVPGHYEQRISSQLYAVPTLPVYDIRNGATVVIPGGDRPPVDLRQGP